MHIYLEEQSSPETDRLIALVLSGMVPADIAPNKKRDGAKLTATNDPSGVMFNAYIAMYRTAAMQTAIKDIEKFNEYPTNNILFLEDRIQKNSLKDLGSFYGTKPIKTHKNIPTAWLDAANKVANT